jgi:hypothetical protein
MARSEPPSIERRTAALLRPVIAQNSAIEYVARVAGTMRFSRGRRGLGSIRQLPGPADALAVTAVDAVPCLFVRQQFQEHLAFVWIRRFGELLPIEPDILRVDKTFHFASPLREAVTAHSLSLRKAYVQ